MWDILTLIGIMIAGLICYALLGGGAYYIWRRPVVNARKHLTFSDFQKEFEGSEYRKDAIEFAYRDLTKVAGFAVLRSDHLWNTLRLDPEEVRDAIDERLAELGIDNVCWVFPIDTVEDCVGFWSYVLEKYSSEVLFAPRTVNPA
jgi:hypothetical protein